jgi:hypothetical protein
MKNKPLTALGTCCLVTTLLIVGLSSSLSVNSKCLLYVENYRLSDNGYLLDAYSPSCLALLNIAIISLCLLLVVGLIHYYFDRKHLMMRRPVIGIMAIGATAWAAVMIITSAVMSAGLSKTCYAIQTSGFSCTNVFQSGFNVDGAGVVPKNLSAASAAIGSAWFTAVCWAIYAGYQWFIYRQAAKQFWVSL